MQLSQWKPLGESLSDGQRRLLGAVRNALPKRDLAGAPEWSFGECLNQEWPSGHPNQPALVIAKLSWRLVQEEPHLQRDMGQWNYQGVAWVNHERIDFSGSYLRDVTTGGFWEFTIKTVGKI